VYIAVTLSCRCNDGVTQRLSRLPCLIAYSVNASDNSVDISVECRCRRVFDFKGTEDANNFVFNRSPLTLTVHHENYNNITT
jgi:hypothetical protein